MSPEAEPLPGMGTPAQPSGSVRAGIEVMIGALANMGKLTDYHRGLCDVARALADTVDRSARSGRAAYATAQAARTLLDTIAALPEPDVVVGDKWEEWLASLNDEDDDDDDTVRAAEVRDPSQS